jgi:hypothetical protein
LFKQSGEQFKEIIVDLDAKSMEASMKEKKEK